MLSEPRTAELLAVSRAMSLVGTGPEKRFDRVVGLIAQYFGMAFGMVALVNGDRLWYKSRVGFDAAESERPGSFTDRVVSTGEPHWVSNALEDEELQHSPWVNGERDRMLAYIGYPLRASDGTVIGCLALMQREPREFTTDQVVQLGLVALWVQDEMTRETESVRAGRVQRALLPRRLVEIDGFELAGASAPARSVGGDFFDWRSNDEGLIFTLADVMGKGGRPATGSEVVDGIEWQIFDYRGTEDSGNLAYAMSTIAGANSVVLYGTADPNEFRTVASTLSADIAAFSSEEVTP